MEASFESSSSGVVVRLDRVARVLASGVAVSPPQSSASDERANYDPLVTPLVVGASLVRRAGKASGSPRRRGSPPR